MKSETKQKQTALIKEHENKNPENFERKKLIFRLLSAMVISRVLYAVMTLVYSAVNGFLFGATEVSAIFLTAFMGLVFSFLIYRAGMKGAAYLALGGGIYSLYVAYNDRVFLFLNTPDVFFNIMNITFVVSILIQTIVMLFISIDNKCNLYLGEVSAIQRELKAWAKSK